MTKSLIKRKITIIKKPKICIAEYQACGLNSILTLLDHYGYENHVTENDLKEIFDYTSEGISIIKHKFFRFNNLLNERKIPYRFYIQRYTSINDLFKYLKKQQIVPLFFWMQILHFTKEKYKNLDYQHKFGDVFQSSNQHLLLFVGFDKEGDEIYFIDPSYQIPFISKNTDDLSSYYFKLKKQNFYECTKSLKVFIEARFSKNYYKKYTKEKKRETQLKIQNEPNA